MRLDFNRLLGVYTITIRGVGNVNRASAERYERVAATETRGWTLHM